MRLPFGMTGVVLLAMALTGGTASAVPAPVGNIPHLAWGAGWQSVIFLSNTGTADASIIVRTYDDTGAAISVPWTTIFNGPSGQAGNPVPTLQFVLRAGALAVISASNDITQGTAWAQILSDVPGIKGGVDFKYASGGVNGEGMVMYDQGTTRVWDMLLFAEQGAYGCDNSYEFTSYAIANTTSAPVTFTRAINNRISGQLEYQDQITLPAYGHMAFIATDLVKQPDRGNGPPVTGVWMLRLTAPAAGQIAPLSLHFRQNISNCATGALVFESLPSWPIQ